MTYQTDERLKSYLDTNQLHREQMCRAVLATEKRFTDAKPRHPRGGPDGGRDIQAIYEGDQTAFGAVGFVNQANDSNEQKKTIKKKFSDDLANALNEDKELRVFVFFTNINLTLGEKGSLIKKAKKAGIFYCDIFDRERIRIVLDSPDGFSIRFHFLNISLSEAEQASFFSKWGDDIQSVISSGFQKVEGTLNRLLFLQEANDPLSHLTFVFELDKKYNADEIGHFRAFCYLTLKEPKHNVLSILFGSSDRSNRMRDDVVSSDEEPGIKKGISSGQWEQIIGLENSRGSNFDEDKEKWNKVGSGSGIGHDAIENIPISYSKDGLIRFYPVISMRDLDDAMFLPFVNQSLATKIRAIHIYSNGYKLQEINRSEMYVDTNEIDPGFPIEFDDGELEDPWVRIRPIDFASTFHMHFFRHTPMRMSTANQVESSLEEKGR